jgi:hypothetical protein
VGQKWHLPYLSQLWSKDEQGGRRMSKYVNAADVAEKLAKEKKDQYGN